VKRVSRWKEFRIITREIEATGSDFSEIIAARVDNARTDSDRFSFKKSVAINSRDNETPNYPDEYQCARGITVVIKPN
jgi:hypothetical protein